MTLYNYLFLKHSFWGTGELKLYMELFKEQQSHIVVMYIHVQYVIDPR